MTTQLHEPPRRGEASEGLACNHAPFGAGLFGDGPTEETRVALFAAKGTPENHREKDRLTDSLRL